MRTINGKLITQDKQNLDNLKHQTANMMQNYQDLETQIAEQNVKHLQDINAMKSHLNTLDKRCILLEESITRQFNQFVAINLCSVIGLVCLWFWFNTSNQSLNQPVNQPIERPTQQPKYPKNKLQSYLVVN